MWLLLLVALVLPNEKFTPGLARPLTKAQVCSTAWGKDRRHVTEAMKKQVAANYGIERSSIKPSGKGPCCEFDHRIPRELGGADDVRNLWAQPWAEAHLKDKEENRLHVAVCSGAMTLEDAQKQILAWHP